MTETLYQVTVLSNFARGFDKYSNVFGVDWDGSVLISLGTQTVSRTNGDGT
jgi:hypothetical protein